MRSTSCRRGTSWSPRTDRVRISRYWDLQFTGDGSDAREEEYLEELDGLLREAVGLRLISDVPLGAFLSGGIDSSAVVAYMKEVSDTPPVTIAVGFDNQAYDEVEHAETVARHLGCEFHPLVANPQVETLLPKLAWHFDEPFADSSAVPTYYVSKAARELVTVALSGDGGDELWAGYARHRVEQTEQRVRGALGSATRLAGWIGQALPLSVKGARSLRHLASDPAQAYALKHAYGMFEPNAKSRLYSSDFAHTVRHADAFASFRDAYRSCASLDPMDRALYVDARTYMIDDVLTKVDRMSMAVSLEAREPLLDHKLLEFAARVPMSLKLKNGQSKYLLRRILERRVPRSISERGKRGFAAPIGDWLRGPLAPMTHELLLDGRLRDRGIFQPREVARLWDEHRTGRADHPHRLWQLVMLELWFRRFIDEAPAPAGAASPMRRHRTHAREPAPSPACAPAARRSRRPCKPCAELRDCRRGPAPRRRARARHAHARRHRASRAGRCGVVRGRSGGARPPAPEHRRSGRGPSAARERGRDRSGSSSTARSTTTPPCGPSSKPRAIATGRGPTPRRSSTPTSSGATRASIASAACSPSRSGTRRAGGCCSRAIGWASSRSTGRWPAAGCCSDRRSSRSSRAG